MGCGNHCSGNRSPACIQGIRVPDSFLCGTEGHGCDQGGHCQASRKSPGRGQAYTMVDEVIKNLESFRREPEIFAKWFEQIESLAGTVRQSIIIPRLTGKQVQRSNQPHEGPGEYYELSIFNVFLDHVIAQQLHDQFSPAQQSSAKLLLIVPSATVKLSTRDRNKLITELAGSYKTELPACDADNHLLKEEAERWAIK